MQQFILIWIHGMKDGINPGLILLKLVIVEKIQINNAIGF